MVWSRPCSGRRDGGGRKVSRQILWVDGPAWRAHRDGALNLVSKLPDVTRPPVVREEVERAGAQLDLGLAETFTGFAEEESRKVRNLLATLTQWRHEDPDDAEAIVKVFAEFPFRDTLLQVGIGGGQHADINGLRSCLTDRHDFALLEEAEQLRLDIKRQVANLIEKERSAGR